MVAFDSDDEKLAAFRSGNSEQIEAYVSEPGLVTRIRELRWTRLVFASSWTNLVDDADTIMAKVRKAKTDPEPLPSEAAGLEGRPEAKNLVGIYAAVTGESVDEVLARFAGQGFGRFKPALADALVALIAPIRSRLDELRRDPAELDRILQAGAETAIALGAPTLAQAKTAVGLTR